MRLPGEFFIAEGLPHVGKVLLHLHNLLVDKLLLLIAWRLGVVSAQLVAEALAGEVLHPFGIGRTGDGAVIDDGIDTGGVDGEFPTFVIQNASARTVDQLYMLTSTLNLLHPMRVLAPLHLHRPGE